MTTNKLDERNEMNQSLSIKNISKIQVNLDVSLEHEQSYPTDPLSHRGKGKSDSANKLRRLRVGLRLRNGPRRKAS